MMATQFLALGVPLEDVLARMTVRPAAALRRNELGRLEAGSIGDATVLRLERGSFTIQDVDGREMAIEERLVAVGVVRAGSYVAATPM